MRSFNLTVKFVGYLIFLTLVPLLAVGLISLRVSTQALTEEYRIFTIELVKDQQEYLDLQLEQVESLIANISGVEEITNALIGEESPDTYTNLATQAQIGYILNGYLNLRGLVSIDIFAQNGEHYHVGDTLNTDNIRADLRDQIYAEALKANQNVLWTGIEDNVNANSVNEKVLTAAKVLKHTNRETLEQEPVGLFLVNYSVTDVYEHFSQIQLGEDAYFIVIDSKGRIIYHPDTATLGARVNRSFLDKLTFDTGTLTIDVDGIDMFVAYAKSSKSNWCVLSLIPVHSIVAKNRPIQTITFSLLLLSFVFVTFSAFWVSKKIVSPIREITDQFKKFQEGTLDYATRLESYGDDEIGQLVVWFNAFVESLAARQIAEKQLSESEERYALAVKGANDGLWDWDLISNQIYLSLRWKQILGYEEDEINTTPDEWLGRIHPECRSRVEAKIDQHLKGLASHFESEHRLLHKDNTYRWVLARGLVLFDGEGVAYRMAGSHTEITTRKQAEKKMQKDAFYDSLTDLPNRTLFFDRLDNSIQRSKRIPMAQFAILFLDLDHFKMVNDSLGHNVGDILLQKVANRLKKSLRSIDTFARLGGDEFGILLDDIKGIRNATQTADKVQNLLSTPFHINGDALLTSASIGIMMNTPEYNSPDEYLRDADVAMYRAKAKGKARYEIFDQTMRDKILRRIELENELRLAIEGKELQLYYQPVIALDNKKLMGFEGLLRWLHPEKGNISPDIFIPVAEETGLMLQLGNWVIEEAAKQLVTWQAEIAGLTKLQMSVNISGKQILHPDLLTQTKKVIKQYSIAPYQFSMEITEGDIINDIETAIAVLQQIRQLGVKIQMDDFGTGYSSLSYLYKLPFDVIKLDRSFVMGIPQDKNKISLIRTVVLMANELDKDVIAEGIETQEELDILTELGCKYGQGFYFSEALDAIAATTFLKEYIAR